jgi:uncharacterized delta-60 repeat protein
LSGSYWYIKGLDVYKAGDNGMIITGGGSYNIVENCAFYENSDTGLQLDNGAAYNQIINCDSYYNFDEPTNGGNADGFSPKITVGTGNYFYGCRSWQNSDDGYDGYLKSTSTYPDNMTTTFENCWCYKNGYLKSGDESNGNGNGFKMGGSNNKDFRHNVILKNCLAFSNRVRGFDQNSNKGSMTLYNCTAFNNGTNYSIATGPLASGKTATVTNCVSAGWGGVDLGSFVVQTKNSWMSPFVVTNADFLDVDPAAAYGPRKADGSLPDITFMHLAAGSDLIDGGINVGLPYRGTAPDLGYDEYIPPQDRASNPKPVNGEEDVNLTPVMSWTAGIGAASHDVYFGIVNPPPFIGNQTAATYSFGTLTANTVYYWRIDEKSTMGTAKGGVWGFITLGPAGPPDVKWIKKYNGSANGSDYAIDIAVDSAKNAYVAGYAKNSGTNYDFLTIKYTPAGDAAWTSTYNSGSANPDYAVAIAIDANSNAIVAGYRYTSATGYDGVIVKYDSAGTQLWANTYNLTGAINDFFYDVAADANGNIYTVGRTKNDCLIVKYSSGGAVLWTKTYRRTSGGGDALYQLAIDKSGNVYACGESTGTGTDQDCLTVKYLPDGTQSWVRTYNGPASGWDLLEAITLDQSGNVYVTGAVETADSDCVTIKYAPDGSQRWVSFYSGTVTGWDESYAIAVTADGNVVVTGYSDGEGTNGDAATVKYNSATGAQIWAKRYNGIGNLDDYAESIAADAKGNVYIHGKSVGIASTNYVTICYDSNGTERWKKNYDGSARLADIGSAIAVSDNKNIYVTGYSMNSSGNYDYATLKYSYPLSSCSARPAGDLNDDCEVNFADFAIMADNYAGSQQNFMAFKTLADTWLQCGWADPYDCW